MSILYIYNIHLLYYIPLAGFSTMGDVYSVDFWQTKLKVKSRMKKKKINQFNINDTFSNKLIKIFYLFFFGYDRDYFTTGQNI